MHALFLGSFFPHELNNDIVANSFGAIANANNTLQLALLEGLSSFYAPMRAVTLPNIGAFPKRYKRAFLPGADISVSARVSGRSVGFFNLVGVKHYSRYRAVKRELNAYFASSHDASLVFVYDLHPPFLAALKELKRSFPHMVICAIVPDLPGFTSDNTSLAHAFFAKHEKNLLNSCFSSIDCYVLLSKHMAEKLVIQDKPWVVVEGIFDEQSGGQLPEIHPAPEKVIFYSGSLDRRNGVLRLVQAFQQLKGSEYRLVLCGAGDTEADIRTAAFNDSRIEFKGQMARSDVLALQKVSRLLVNPRTPEGEFTRYSFPSKTMEYLASSVPLLMHRLEGVPDEYFNHAFVLDDLSTYAMAQEIDRICNLPSEIINARSAAARNFILQEKNPMTQCRKIFDLLCGLASEGRFRQ